MAGCGYGGPKRGNGRRDGRGDLPDGRRGNGFGDQRLGGRATGSGGGFTQDAKIINAQLCKYASCGDLQGLLDYVTLRRDYMNYVNLSTAMHKLAHLVRDGNRVIHLGDRRFAALHDRIYMSLVLQRTEASMPGSEAMPRCWATIAWSYATIHLAGLDLQPIFSIIAELSLPCLEIFKQFEFTNLLWAFAKGQVHNVHFFQAARAHIATHIQSFSRSHLSLIVWALVTAQQYQASMLCKLTERFIKTCGTERVDPVGISNLMWGIATANVHPKLSLLHQIGNDALELLPAFKPQELSITAWAFSRLGVRHDRIFAAVARRLCQEPILRQQMHAQGLANLLWAFNRQKKLDSKVWLQLASAMHALLPRTVVLFNSFKTREFLCICQSLQESGVHWGTCPEATAFWDRAYTKMAQTQRAQNDADAAGPEATAFWDRAYTKMAQTQRAQNDADIPMTCLRPGIDVRSESYQAVETESASTADSAMYAYPDGESEDGDRLGMLNNDMFSGDCGDRRKYMPLQVGEHPMDGDKLGMLSGDMFAADSGESALRHRHMPLQIGKHAMAAPGGGYAEHHMTELQFPPRPGCSMQTSLHEAAHAADWVDPPASSVKKIEIEDPEASEDTFPYLQPLPPQEAHNDNMATKIAFENHACYIVKNTFVEAADVDTTKKAEALYCSEPPPVGKAAFNARKLLKFPTLVQRCQ